MALRGNCGACTEQFLSFSFNVHVYSDFIGGLRGNAKTALRCFERDQSKMQIKTHNIVIRTDLFFKTINTITCMVFLHRLLIDFKIEKIRLVICFCCFVMY